MIVKLPPPASPAGICHKYLCTLHIAETAETTPWEHCLVLQLSTLFGLQLWQHGRGMNKHMIFPLPPRARKIETFCMDLWVFSCVAKSPNRKMCQKGEARCSVPPKAPGDMSWAYGSNPAGMFRQNWCPPGFHQGLKMHVGLGRVGLLGGSPKKCSI